MPAKVYSKEQKEQIKIKLLETALQMYSKHGIRNVTLMDVLSSVGISKPFFYTFYKSVQEFVICAIEYQWTQFPNIIDKINAEKKLSWEEKVYKLLKIFINYNEVGFLIMTQEEEVWVRERVDDERYQNFMKEQKISFDELLKKWDISSETCNSSVVANMLLSMVIVHSSAKKSLPFFYLDVLDETAEAHAQSIIAYLKPLRMHSDL